MPSMTNVNFCLSKMILILLWYNFNVSCKYSNLALVFNFNLNPALGWAVRTLDSKAYC